MNGSGSIGRPTVGFVLESSGVGFNTMEGKVDGPGIGEAFVLGENTVDGGPAELGVALIDAGVGFGGVDFVRTASIE